MKTSFKILLLIPFLLLTGCADFSYYMHSVKGQFSIMSETRDIEDVLADDSTDAKLKQKLILVGQIRQFAFQQLDLPESDSYTEYADLGRPYVLKNLFAAAEFSTTLKRWCYPIAGCAGYRGYFEEDRLQQYKQELEKQKMDIYIANIPAYSTLGWFDDPLLNTFINWPDHYLAGLIFHELAHQKLYIDDDTEFNESFAVAVQQTGVEKWLNANKQSKQAERYEQYQKNRQLVIQLIEKAREDLKSIYTGELLEEEKRQKKQLVLQKLKQDYQQLSSGFKVLDGFKHWFEGELNNAKLASVSTYHSTAPAFRNILKHLKGNYSAFYNQVESISRLAKKQRHECLDRWMSAEKRPANC